MHSIHIIHYIHSILVKNPSVYTQDTGLLCTLLLFIYTKFVDVNTISMFIVGYIKDMILKLSHIWLPFQYTHIINRSQSRY